MEIYNEAVTFLRQRPCVAVMHDFDKNNFIMRTMQKSCALCNISLQAPFGELIRLLHDGWRQGNERSFKYLARLYFNCLDGYNTTGDHNEIREKQSTAVAFFMHKFNPKIRSPLPAIL